VLTDDCLHHRVSTRANMKQTTATENDYWAVKARIDTALETLRRDLVSWTGAVYFWLWCPVHSKHYGVITNTHLHRSGLHVFHRDVEIKQVCLGVKCTAFNSH